MRVHILGASGAGTTTLGLALSARFGTPHFDTDDFYWFQSDPPFEAKRPIEERILLLDTALRDQDDWVLSGSMMGWGDRFLPYFDLVVYLYLPREIRMRRLKRREVERYGAHAIQPGGHLHANCEAFLSWANSYENAAFPGRSLSRHTAWLAGLPCPVLRIEGDLTTVEQLDRVLAAAV